MTSVTEGPCTGTAPEAGLRCTRVAVRARGRDLTLGETAGDRVVHTGDAVVVDVQTSRVVGHRAVHVPALVVLAAAGLALFAWWRGLALLCGLGLVVVIARFYAVPAVEDGHGGAAVGAAAASAAVVALAAFLHGTDARSAIAAVAGVVSVCLGAIAASAAHAGDLVTTGMLLAGTGAVVEIGIRQVDATWDARDETGWLSLVAGGLRRGRATLAGTSSVLGAALVGVAVPVIATSRDDIDLARGAVALLSVALVVPVAAALAASVVAAERDA